MPLNKVTITGTFDDGSGTALSGTAVFTPSQTVYYNGQPIVQTSNPVSVAITGGALQAVQLVATDNTPVSFVSQTGFWFWTVSITLNGVNQPGFSFFLPRTPTTVDLYALANTAAGGASVTFPITIGQGGTGQITQQAAIDALAGAVTSGQFLRGNGTHMLVAPIQAADLPAGTGLQPWQFFVEAAAYGAKGDGKIVTDVSTTSASKVITSATAAFTAGDVGKRVMINGANGTTSAPLIDVIASVQSGTQATLTTNNAGVTATNCQMVWGTDDTAAINLAVSAAKTYALANGFFAQILFGAKIYILAAAPTQTSTPAVQNAQIPLPYPNVNGSTQKLTISLQGAGIAGFADYFSSSAPSVSGTALVSMQTAPGTVDPTFGHQSVIGGPSGGGAFSGGFANMGLYVDGITVWYPVLTNMYPWDLGFISGCEWGAFGAIAFAPGNTGTAPRLVDLPPLLTTTSGVGCRFPLVGNNDDVAGRSFICEGISLPLIVGDHFTCPRVASVHCDVAGRIDLVNGISNLAHAVVISNWSVENYNGGLQCNGGGTGFCFVNINMDTETIGGNSAPVFDINDNGNLYGVIRVTDAKGRTQRFPTVLNGAPNLKIINDMIGPGHMASPPAVPASTSTATVQYRDAWVTVHTGAGVTVSAITVDGTATGLTMAASSTQQVRVASGKTIALTYAGGTPTWDWWLD